MPSVRRLKYLLLHMALVLFTLSAMVCLLASIIFLLHPTSSLSLPSLLQQTLPSYLQPEHLGWGTPSVPAPSSWNILYHLGGNGPWIENRLDSQVEGGLRVPDGCTVDMVHMMSRHAERYPTTNVGIRMLDLLERVRASKRELRGALEFLNDWDYFTNTPSSHFEQLTTTGPYSGILEAFTTGVKLNTRYLHLWNDSSNIKTALWASDSGRVIDTARYFSAGFFGLESGLAEVIVIGEEADRGGDTLTPGDTCKDYVEDENEGHDMGYDMLAKFRSTYLGAISERLGKENPEFDFTDSEVYSMQEMCGFETTVRGSSPWCSVFTHEEWLSFEYARDILHFYRAGPGNKYSRAMGWLWLNATTNLLLEGPESAGPLYFSFVHDGDIVPMLAALGLFEDEELLPITHVPALRNWTTSQITPMGGRIIFERLTCESSSSSSTSSFVRFNVNDGIMPLDGCSDGPGGSCPLATFAEHVQRRGELAGDFRDTCGLGKDAAEKITFLRQPAFGGPASEPSAAAAAGGSV